MVIILMKYLLIESYNACQVHIVGTLGVSGTGVEVTSIVDGAIVEAAVGVAVPAEP